MIRPEDRQETVEWAQNLHHDEIRALQAAQEIAGIPKCLAHEVQAQGREHENPGGYFNLIVMSWMPGKPAPEYYNLSPPEKENIQEHVVRILK